MNIVVERKGDCRIIVPTNDVKNMLSKYFSGNELSIEVLGNSVSDADIFYTLIDYPIDIGNVSVFNGILVIDSFILSVYKDPFLVRSLVSRGFVKSWIPIGSGLVLLIKSGFDKSFLKETIEVYRESFIKGPNPVHYNTAYLLYIITKYATKYYSRGVVIEVGTGRGFSTLWLAHACMETGCKVVSYDISMERIESAKSFLKKLDLIDYVELVSCDARKPIDHIDEVNILFIDGKKDEYLDYLKAFEHYLTKGAVVLAHNTISNSDQTANYIRHVYNNYKSITILSDPAGITISVKTNSIK